MHRTYICDVERGSRNVSLESIDRIARALEIRPGTLFLNFRMLPTDTQPFRPASANGVSDILLAEHDPEYADMALDVFRQANIANRIQFVRDGAAALDFLFCTGTFSSRPPEALPQMILLDLTLPKVDGLEVLRRIKAHARLRSVPVVALTGSNRHPDVIESQQLGVKAHIVKPLDIQNFSNVVSRLNLRLAVLKPTYGAAK